MPKIDIRGRDFLRLADFTAEEINSIIDLATDMKKEQKSWSLAGKTVIMLFFNSSLRTRTSFEIGTYQLGAHPVVLNVGQDSWDLEWKEGIVMDGERPEHIKDAAKVLSRYGDVIARAQLPQDEKLRRRQGGPDPERLLEVFQHAADQP